MISARITLCSRPQTEWKWNREGQETSLTRGIGREEFYLFPLPVPTSPSLLQGLPLWLSWWRIHLQCGRPGFDPWVGKIPWRREWLPTPVFWCGEFHGLYSPWGRKDSDTTEWLSLSSLSPGVNPYRTRDICFISVIGSEMVETQLKPIRSELFIFLNCLKQIYFQNNAQKHRLRLPSGGLPPFLCRHLPASLNARENTVEGNMQSQTIISSKDKRFGPKPLNIINPITVKSVTE